MSERVVQLPRMLLPGLVHGVSLQHSHLTSVLSAPYWALVETFQLSPGMHVVASECSECPVSPLPYAIELQGTQVELN